MEYENGEKLLWVITVVSASRQKKWHLMKIAGLVYCDGG